MNQNRYLSEDGLGIHIDFFKKLLREDGTLDIVLPESGIEFSMLCEFVFGSTIKIKGFTLYDFLDITKKVKTYSINQESLIREYGLSKLLDLDFISRKEAPYKAKIAEYQMLFEYLWEDKAFNNELGQSALSVLLKSVFNVEHTFGNASNHLNVDVYSFTVYDKIKSFKENLSKPMRLDYKNYLSSLIEENTKCF